MSNFTPTMENGKENVDSLGRPDMYGWVMGQLGFKALDISKKVYEEGNVLKADAYIFFSTIILLLLRDGVAYRSYDSAKNVLLSCLKK